MNPRNLVSGCSYKNKYGTIIKFAYYCREEGFVFNYVDKNKRWLGYSGEEVARSVNEISHILREEEVMPDEPQHLEGSITRKQLINWLRGE